jgi:hypothetical protein
VRARTVLVASAITITIAAVVPDPMLNLGFVRKCLPPALPPDPRTSSGSRADAVRRLDDAVHKDRSAVAVTLAQSRWRHRIIVTRVP